MRRSAPRPLALAVEALADRVAPLTPLAEVQRAWPDVVGPAVAAQSRPDRAHEGVLTVVCAAAVWSQELELMGPALIARVNQVLGRPAVSELRVRTGSG